MEENLKSIIQLFKSDNKIKEILFKIAPPDFYNEDDVIHYSDKLMEALDDISFEMEQIYSQQAFFIPSNIPEIIMQHLNQIKVKIQQTFKPNELKKIYIDFFSNMSPDFVNHVGNVCVGYTRNEHCYSDLRYINLSDVALEATSVNEMLHLLHSYVCNNDIVFSNMPIISQKNIGIYGNCTLFGMPNNIAKDIFNSMPTSQKDSIIGETYIIGLDNKVLMMVRDMGHALTIEIDEDKDKKTVFVRYFIPKICDPAKVNKLKGINKVPVNQEWADIFANGMFETSVDGFGKDIVNFIEQVPTDEDIAHSPPPTPEEELKYLARIDIDAKITESEENSIKTFVTWIKKKDNKFLEK